MKVLVACEFSGTVRDAFLARGHDAWSCDLLPTESPGPHFQCDVLEIIDRDWDLMVAHPPCQYLSHAGIAWWNQPGRKEKRDEAFEFFMKLYNAPIPKAAVENSYSLEINRRFRRPDQIVHPYYFGTPEMKKICLWLRGVPRLTYSLYDNLFFSRTATDYPTPSRVDNTRRRKKRYFVDSACGGTCRAKVRSIFFPSVARAMAEQWG